MEGEAAVIGVTDTHLGGLILAGDGNGTTGVPPASQWGQGKAYTVSRLGMRQHEYSPRCVLVKINPS